MKTTRIKTLLEYLQTCNDIYLTREVIDKIGGKRARLDINILIKRGHIINKVRDRKHKITAVVYKGYEPIQKDDTRHIKRTVVNGNIEEVVLPPAESIQEDNGTIRDMFPKEKIRSTAKAGLWERFCNMFGK